MLKGAVSIILSAVLALGTISAYASESEDENKTNPENRTSPISDLFDESDINPEYIEWLENGSQGVAPSMQDFSYLSESYTKYFSRQNYSALQELPEKYDLRDTGKVSPVYNQELLGVCWAVSANSVAESSLLDQFPHTSFSSIHTAWFSYRGDEEEEFYQTNDPYMQGGSHTWHALSQPQSQRPVYAGRFKRICSGHNGCMERPNF